LVCVFRCFCSLSAGPLAAAMTQIYLLLWDGALKKVKSRWNILAGLSILAYIVIDIISNRTPFHVFVSYLAFNTSSAYHRIRIWIYGTQNIWENPIFGIGMNDWERPFWMVPSIDMFWIVPAMHHGVLVWVLWLCLFFWIFFSISNRRGLGDRMQWYRMGYLCSMAGIFISGWTVHYWDVTYVFLMFSLGFGMWILDWTEEDDEEESQATETSKKTTPYSRFPVRPREETMARGPANG